MSDLFEWWNNLGKSEAERVVEHFEKKWKSQNKFDESQVTLNRWFTEDLENIGKRLAVIEEKLGIEVPKDQLPQPGPGKKRKR
jgi:hypothetical protein